MKNTKLLTLSVFILLFGLSACKSAEMATEGTPAPASTEMPMSDAEPETQTQTAISPTSVNVDEIVNMHIEARGGKEAIQGIQSIQMTGVAEAMGMNLDLTMSMKRPFMLRAQILIESMNAEVNQGFDGETAWMQNPGSDPQAMPESVAAQFKDQADLDGPFVDYKSKDIALEYLGTESVDGNEAHKIKIIREGLPDTIAYIDSSSYLEVKSVSDVPNPQSGELSTSETLLRDFKEVNGVQFPHTIEVKMDGNTMQTLKFEKIEANVELNDSIFEMPGMSIDIQ